MRREPLLLGSYVFTPPSFPILSRGRCHASGLIDSQISMSLYDTPGSCGCDERQHSHWFCRSTSIELWVQARSQHMCLCPLLLNTEQRSLKHLFFTNIHIIAWSRWRKFSMFRNQNLQISFLNRWNHDFYLWCSSLTFEGWHNIIHRSAITLKLVTSSNQYVSRLFLRI